MKTDYAINDKVWIHLGEPNLVEGRVVLLFNLEHLNEGHDPAHIEYIIEIKTGIENIYECRDFDSISPDKNGPIALFRNLNSVMAGRKLKQLGVKLPHIGNVDEHDLNEPTSEQINAALIRTEQSNKHPALTPQSEMKPKRRSWTKKKSL